MFAKAKVVAFSPSTFGLHSDVGARQRTTSPPHANNTHASTAFHVDPHACTRARDVSLQRFHAGKWLTCSRAGAALLSCVFTHAVQSSCFRSPPSQALVCPSLLFVNPGSWGSAKQLHQGHTVRCLHYRNVIFYMSDSMIHNSIAWLQACDNFDNDPPHAIYSPSLPPLQPSPARRALAQSLYTHCGKCNVPFTQSIIRTVVL